jgi:carboxyl-terminal processing protease
MAVLTRENLGYLRITTFDWQNIADQVEDALTKIAGCDGVVLDLRQNSGGRMDQALDCCGFFINNGQLATIEFRHGDGIKKDEYFVNESQFFAIETLPDSTETTTKFTRRAPVLAGKPLVILINRRTASAGELMTVVLVQNGEVGKVLMVGSDETPGKGIGQAEYPILEGLATVCVTRCRWLCPGGEWLGDCGQTHRNGIAPDVIVPDDHGPEAIKAGLSELRKMLGRPEPL